MDQKQPLIVHIIPKEKFTYDFIAFTNSTFPNENITFFVYGVDDSFSGYVPSSEKNVYIFSYITEIIQNSVTKQILNNSSLIIINGVWEPSFLAKQMHGYLSKCLLLFWGGDFYPYLQVVNPIKQRKVFLYKLILKYLIKKARGILTLVTEDKSEIDKLCPRYKNWTNTPITEFTKTSAKQKSIEMQNVLNKTKSNETINILVGNSATETNRHKAVLNALKKYSTENIRIHVPLSYGDRDYALSVIDYGNNLFGSKFCPITDFIEKENYYLFLQNIHIALFNNNRQQALGNIRYLLGYGAKIFLASDNPMYQSFRKDNYCIFDIADIPNLDFRDFIAFDHASAWHNFHIVDPCKLFSFARNAWQQIYQSTH